MLGADPNKVSKKAKKRGLPQLGTLGAGNHYAEIQVVDEIFNKEAANKMGIERTGQVVIMIHSGSRGFGHQVYFHISTTFQKKKKILDNYYQVATDALVEMEKAMKRDGIKLNDKQLACARINSPEGENYLAGLKQSISQLLKMSKFLSDSI